MPHSSSVSGHLRPDIAAKLDAPFDKTGMRGEKLNRKHTNELFFEDSAFVGIVAPVPASRFCWIVNQHFYTSFSATALVHMNVVAKEGKEDELKRSNVQEFTVPTLFGAPPPPAATPSPGDSASVSHEFPVYMHGVVNSSFRHLLYKLRQGKLSLLTGTRTKQYDYLWMIQTASPYHDAHLIVDLLMTVPEVRLAQELTVDDVSKNFDNLIL